MAQKPTYEELEQRVLKFEKTESELKLAFDKIQENEERYRSFIMNFKGIAFRGHMDFTPIFFHGAVQEITGYTEKEFLKGKPRWDQVICPEDLPLLFTEDETKLHSIPNYSYEREYRIIRKDGANRWVHEIIQNICDNSGNPDLMQGAIYDITERRLAEEELGELFRMSLDMICTADLNTASFLKVNPAFSDILGYSEKELLGKPFIDLIHPEDVNPTLALIEDELKKGKKVVNFKNRYRCKDGDFRWFNWVSHPVPEKGLTYAVAHDITDEMRSEESLRKSEAKYRSMMDSMVDAVYICSPEFKVGYMNPAMIERLGRDATGEVCYRVIHGSDERCESCVFDEVTQGETIERNFESPLDNRTYRITDMPVQNEDGTISKMTILRDITDYLNAVEEKEIARVQLLQAQKMESIGNLAGGIAHDFNNILTSIIGYTELAIDEVEQGSDIEDKLQQVFYASERARDLVKQILAFARQSDAEVKPLKISAIVKDVLKFLRSSIPTTIVIKEYIESNAIIMGNPTQVHQILMNLCTNAAFAMEDEGGILEVTINDLIIDDGDRWKDLNLESGNYIQLQVSDTGTGISPEIIESIFEPYFTTKDTGEGTGMGLALVHGIIESYGGKITVESTVGKGSTFTIYLAVIRKLTEKQPYQTEKVPMGNENILFIDDEVSIANIGGQLLKRLGYSVATLSSSLEALELFRTNPSAFDLIITDMTMPDMTGDALAAELIKIRSDIPIILCTGYSKKISEVSASEIGIKAFVFKPIIKDDLAKTIREVLDNI